MAVNGDQTDAKTISVLVAEDDQDQSDFLRSILEMEGYQVEVAMRGDDAWRLLTSRRHHIAILDLRMPGLAGGTLLQACRVMNPPIRIPIILVSAHATELERRQFQADGASAFFAKPYDVIELLKKIKELVKRK